ncbi:MAG: VOC family protein [Oscillospiraceae bacterium]|nr:VOC family protein [Oscillospiraceae bacterium]
MYIKWITISVSDMAASKKFYKELLGLSEMRAFSPAPGREICFLGTDNGVQIELLGGVEQLSVGTVSIGLCAGDYDMLYEKAKAQGAPLSDPQVMGDGLRCFFLRDPDGVKLQIIKDE